MACVCHVFLLKGYDLMSGIWGGFNTSFNQIWAYFCMNTMTTYISVFGRICKYKYNGVLLIFSKYVKIQLKVFYFFRVRLSRRILAYLEICLSRRILSYLHLHMIWRNRKNMLLKNMTYLKLWVHFCRIHLAKGQIRSYLHTTPNHPWLPDKDYHHQVLTWVNLSSKSNINFPPFLKSKEQWKFE